METLYWQPPPADELAAVGLLPEDYPPPECNLWEENWPAVRLFSEVSTQWRTGASGVVGLDYSVVFHEIERKPVEDYDDMMWGIRIIESEALKLLNRPA